jgi:imidazolonepropionase-like amidohydrolase
MEKLAEYGLAESEIIKGATIYPAEWLQITDYYGAIAPNRQANILIVNSNPLEAIQNIRTVHMVF